MLKLFGTKLYVCSVAVCWIQLNTPVFFSSSFLYVLSIAENRMLKFPFIIVLESIYPLSFITIFFAYLNSSKLSA